MTGIQDLDGRKNHHTKMYGLTMKCQSSIRPALFYLSFCIIMNCHFLELYKTILDLKFTQLLQELHKVVSYLMTDGQQKLKKASMLLILMKRAY